MIPKDQVNISVTLSDNNFQDQIQDKKLENGKNH